MPEQTFEKELEHLINRYSVENESNTPDFLLAQFVRGCLTVFAGVTMQREHWYGRSNVPGTLETEPALRCQERGEAGAQCLQLRNHDGDHLFRVDTAAVWGDPKPPPTHMPSHGVRMDGRRDEDEP